MTKRARYDECYQLPLSSHSSLPPSPGRSCHLPGIVLFEVHLRLCIVRLHVLPLVVRVLATESPCGSGPPHRTFKLQYDIIRLPYNSVAQPSG